MIRRREERKTRRQGGAAQRFKIIQQAGEGAYRKALGSATVRVASYTESQQKQWASTLLPRSVNPAGAVAGARPDPVDHPSVENNSARAESQHPLKG